MFELFSPEEQEQAQTREPSYESSASVHEIAALRSYNMRPMLGQIAMIDVNFAEGTASLSEEAL